MYNFIDKSTTELVWTNMKKHTGEAIIIKKKKQKNTSVGAILPNNEQKQTDQCKFAT
jgi:hypothetical protein